MSSPEPPRGPRTAEQRARADAQRMGLALFPVRLFLGLTFVYGGIQKLSDPGFLHAGAATYIGTQLRGFANGTPGGFLLRTFAIPHPVLSGVGVAVAEIAIGLLVTAGVATRPAAAAGLVLNLVLFLTNSWRTYPYFLGSDIVFVFAWLPFVVVGAARQPTLEPGLHRLAAVRARGRGADAGASARERAGRRRTEERAPATVAVSAVTRRTAVGSGLGLLGAAVAAISGLSLLARGRYRAPRVLSTTRVRHPAPRPAPVAEPAVAAPAATARTAAPALPRGAVKLGPAGRLARGQGATYADPADGRPDIVIRQRDGSLLAHSAVCTHAGCTVGYQGGQIVCPCHGAVFDARTGAVLGGPASAPLSPRKVLERDGSIYALPS